MPRGESGSKTLLAQRRAERAVSWRSSTETVSTERYLSNIQQAAVYTAAPPGEASVLSIS